MSQRLVFTLILTIVLVAAISIVNFSAAPTISTVQAQAPALKSPAEGYNVHVLAPHVVHGKVMGPYHHYCKVMSPEPVIECLCYLSNEPNARLEQVEYILAKSITRNGAVT